MLDRALVEPLGEISKRDHTTRQPIDGCFHKTRFRILPNRFARRRRKTTGLLASLSAPTSRARSNLLCSAPALKGHRVCRCHGVRGGVPRGTANGRYLHGRFTCEALAVRAEIAELVRV